MSYFVTKDLVIPQDRLFAARADVLREQSSVMTASPNCCIASNVSSKNM